MSSSHDSSKSSARRAVNVQKGPRRQIPRHQLRPVTLLSNRTPHAARNRLRGSNRLQFEKYCVSYYTVKQIICLRPAPTILKFSFSVSKRPTSTPLWVPG